MAPVMTSTNMPTDVAVPWKIRSDGSQAGIELPRRPVAPSASPAERRVGGHPNRPWT